MTDPIYLIICYQHGSSISNFVTPIDDGTYCGITDGVQASGQEVSSPELNFVISRPIDLKLGICICFSDTECCAKES